MTADERLLWPELAELFFLDQEIPPAKYQCVAELLKDRGWTRAQVERGLVELVAPAAGINVAYLVYPVIGEWAGFDSRWLNARIVLHRRWRARRPRWCLRLQNKWCRHMLKQLQWEQLLDLLR